MSASLLAPPYDVSLSSSTCDCFQAAPVTRFIGQWQSTNTLRRTRLFRKGQQRDSWVFVRHFIGLVTGDIHVSIASGVRCSTAFLLPRSNRGNKDTKGRLRLDKEEPVLLRRLSSDPYSFSRFHATYRVFDVFSNVTQPACCWPLAKSACSWPLLWTRRSQCNPYTSNHDLDCFGAYLQRQTSFLNVYVHIFMYYFPTFHSTWMQPVPEEEEWHRRLRSPHLLPSARALPRETTTGFAPS